MKFVWDENKAEANLKKHGVSFAEAETVFSDWEDLLIYAPDSPMDEDLFLLMGLCSVSHMLVVCHCYREQDEQVRIISTRKATRRESTTYERRK